MVMFVGALISCLLSGGAAFQPQRAFPLAKSFQWAERPAGTRTHSTASSAEFDLSISEGDAPAEQQAGDDNLGLEVWLDLRGTSLTPNTAIELWEMEEQNGQSTNLQSDALPFTKCLVNSSTHNLTGQTSEVDVGVLLEENNDQGQCISLQKANQSTSSGGDLEIMGRIIRLETSSTMPVLPDPLPAMEACSRGEWVILDTRGWEKISEEEQIGMVLPLLELISSAGSGGIGLTCQTKNAVVKAAMFIQTMTNGGGGPSGTKTLESGIVVPDGGTSRTGENRSRSGAFAIVVPYDVALLRAAKLLLVGDSRDADDRE
ncbi:hypothetical protein ACHAXT_011169 [Thalassiosira profunda]